MAHVNEFDHTSNPFTFTGSVQRLELGITKSGELLPNTTSYDYFNSTVSEMIDVDYENTVLRTWTKIYYPLVAFVGITSNVFNLLVLTKKSLIKKSSNVYLVGLAIADILVVVFQATFKYAVFKAYLVRSPQWFYVFLCVHNNSVLIAARRWNFGITAAFTIERYIHIRHPLKGKIWCTPRKAKIVVVVIFIVAALFGSHASFLREVNDDGRCVYAERVKHIIHYMTTMNACTYLITYAILVLFNGLIIYHVHRQTRKRQGMIASPQQAKNIKSQNRVTFTLICVSAAFMILEFPWLLTYLQKQLPSNNTHDASRTDYLALCAEHMGVLNSVINLFLYCYMNKRFRTELRGLFCAAGHVRHTGRTEAKTNNSLQPSSSA